MLQFKIYWQVCLSLKYILLFSRVLSSGIIFPLYGYIIDLIYNKSISFNLFSNFKDDCFSKLSFLKRTLKFSKSNPCNKLLREIYSIPVPSNHCEQLSFNLPACYIILFCTLLFSLTISTHEDHTHSLLYCTPFCHLFSQSPIGGYCITIFFIINTCEINIIMHKSHPVFQ